ncbi:killer cell lectin-like receptor subfamily G member 2 isoform X3 [Manis pentadactyla]|uniref:killer cell lectin-like receptor subfamily G member 2 isoform X3 n=1 Tax=Manis pentadactyla TaxID=143292 RepID=UPI00255C8A23|nr:killer cell lectin-like receptor subfamily G member 2 isoform X3 [Manis pentadactyla]
MECATEASGGDPGGAELPMEPLTSQVPGPEQPQPQVPAEKRRAESPEGNPALARAVREAAGAGQELVGGKKLPRPSLLRLPPPSLGYGAFRRQASAGAEPPSPGPTAAEQPRDGEAPAGELVPWAAPGEPTAGAWAPMELQVDVRVKPVGAAGGSRAPSPAPSTRFLTVPVPESPAFSRHASPAYPFLPRTPSPGGTWGRGASLAPARAERGSDTEGRASPTEGRAESPGSPTCRCHCQKLGLKEDTDLLRHAEPDGDTKLPRAIKLMGARCRPCPQGWMWSEKHCYYLSAEAQAWEASHAFCSAHHATLPLLSHTQDFLSRYPVSKYSWVGARRGPQGWHWIDGASLPPQLLPEEEDKPDLQCGGLQGGKLVALDCASLRPWICAKGSK